MKFTITREKLQEGLVAVAASVPTKTTLPVLSNILVEATRDGLRLSGTDLDIAVSTTIPASVDQEGAITLPARKLVELVRELPSKPVSLTLRDNGWVDLACDKGKFRLVGLPADEYPPLEITLAEGSLAVDGGRLRTLVARTSYAMSVDESRPFLNGLYLVARQRELRVVATDGHRLALARTVVETDGEMAGIVPRKAVQELTRVLGSAERVDLAVGDSKFFVRTEGFELVSKLVEGQFPNYEQVIPKTSPVRVVVEREPLLAAIRRVAVIADDRTRPVRLSLAAGEARLSAQSQELGEAEETLPAHGGSGEVTIGFNARYLVDALGAMDGAWTVIGLKDGLSPGVFLGAPEREGAPDESYRCVIMPMRM